MIKKFFTPLLWLSVSVLIFCAVILPPKYQTDAIPPNIPPGAAALGYTKRVINEQPQFSDIAPGNTGNYKWFSGLRATVQSPPIPLNHYKTAVNGALGIELGGTLMSIDRNFNKGSSGLLPLLPGKDGFYVEFETSLSGTNLDYFPAVWLLPKERNNMPGGIDDHYPDVYPNDPVGFERYLEIDVDEGNLNDGILRSISGTVYNWKGIGTFWDVTNFTKIFGFCRPINSLNPIDRTQKHIFGASYDPLKSAVTWWFDGKFQGTTPQDTYSYTSPQGVRISSNGNPLDPVFARQNFYLIISTQSWGKNVPYTQFIHSVKAFVPPSSALPKV